MANYITKKKINILRCSCGAMGLLHDYLVEIIKKEKIEVSDKILEFIDRIDQNIYGSGAIWVELDEHLPDNEDRLMLKNLVGKVVDRLKAEGSLDERVADRIIGSFEDFKNKII